jgi:polysaccharide export outer membrane protein
MKPVIFAIFALGFLLPIGGYAQAVIRKGDVFEIRLSGIPVEYAQEFAFAYTVGDDGEVRIPLIGQMRAAGISFTQLSRNIERKLVSDKIFTNPTCIFLNSGSRFVTVGGAVRAPQAVPWNSDTTLTNAITRAGDFTEFADRKKVKVMREGQVSYYNTKRIDKDPTQNPKLLPGDEVYVKE